MIVTAIDAVAVVQDVRRINKAPLVTKRAAAIVYSDPISVLDHTKLWPGFRSIQYLITSSGKHLRHVRTAVHRGTAVDVYFLVEFVPVASVDQTMICASAVHVSVQSSDRTKMPRLVLGLQQL